MTVQSWTCEVGKVVSGWTNLRILVPSSAKTGPKPALRFNLASNSQRFALSTDHKRLCDRFPQIAEEVVAWWESRCRFVSNGENP
jgi:hypothetical protein